MVILNASRSKSKPHWSSSTANSFRHRSTRNSSNTDIKMVQRRHLIPSISFSRPGKSTDEAEVLLRVSLKDIQPDQSQSPSLSSENSVKSSSSRKKSSARLTNNNQPLPSIDESEVSSRTSCHSVNEPLLKNTSCNQQSQKKKGSRFLFDRIDEDVTVPVSHTKNGDETAIRRLVTSDLWSDNAGRAEQGLKKLSNILGVKKSAQTSLANRTIVFKAGGHLAIVQAMRKHRSHEGVQAEGCRALGIAAEDIADPENENAIAMIGGIDAILSSMRHFSNNEVIQDFGCGALQNLTGLEENAKIMMEKDGLQVVLIAMRKFPHNSLVQESACWTLVNLCMVRQHKTKLEKAKCLNIVASAIDNHPRSIPVKQAATEALKHVLDMLDSKETSSSSNGQGTLW